jgi:Leucine-rich repeat (LRR) protein
VFRERSYPGTSSEDAQSIYANPICVSILVLDDNELDQLPSEMKQLAKLKTLSLRNNSILKCLVCVKQSKN